MRCPSCAAFVDDDATSCTSCGSEVSFEPPPPPPPEALAPDPSAEVVRGDDMGGRPGGGAYAPPPMPPPPPAADGAGTCDGCHGSFAAIQLTRIHSQRLCADCGAKIEDRTPRPSSGRMPSPSGGHAKPVSRVPLIAMGAVVVLLAGVAVYFTVFGKKIEHLGNTGPKNPPPSTTPATTAPGPGTGPVQPPPPPPARPKDIKFVGVLQSWEKDVDGEPVYLAFVSDEDGRELRVTGVDKYLAEDFQIGKAYRISFREIPTEDKMREIRYTLKTKIEPAN